MPLHHGPKVGWVVGRYAAEPAIRWRFGWYAQRRGIAVTEATENGSFDVIWLSQVADYTRWSRYAGRAKIIVDLCDDYLSIPQYSWPDVARQVAKFAVGQHRRLRLSYTRVLREMCGRADAIVCASDLQEAHLKHYCANVHQILDVHSELCSRVKTSYASGSVANIVWQGFPGNISSFRDIVPVLTRVGRRRPFDLHVITNRKRPALLRDYWARDTQQILDRLFGFRHVYLYDWNSATLPHIVTACDLAVIPISNGQPFWSGKPANKLFIFWRLGVPALAAATPAYLTAMQGAGLDMCCRDEADWERKLENLLADEDARRHAGLVGRAFVEEHFSEAQILAQWDRLLASVL